MIDFVDLDDAFLMYGTVGDTFYIDVDTSMKNASISALRGGLAHELCHITESVKTKGFFKKVKGWLYWRSILFQSLDERNTDLETILRGYGNDLLAMMAFYNENPSGKIFKTPYTGLTYDEILSIKKQFSAPQSLIKGDEETDKALDAYFSKKPIKTKKIFINPNKSRNDVRPTI